MNNGKFPRTSQEAFGTRFQESDFEEKKISRFDLGYVLILILLSSLLFLK